MIPLRLPDEPPPAGLDEVEAHTLARLPEGVRMLAGPAQGALLRQLARESLPMGGQVLEVGTFTGYGTRWLIEGLAGGPWAHGHRPGLDCQVHTIEVDPRHEPFLRRHWVAQGVAPYVTLHLADGLALCQAWADGEPLADGCGLRQAPEHLWANARAWSGEDVRAEAATSSDNGGESRSALGRFGLVVVDADKRRYGAYLEACRMLLAPGGVMAFDNVLWRGMTRQLFGNQELTGQGARQATHARALGAFLEGVLADETLEATLVEERDGLLLVRERGGR